MKTFQEWFNESADDLYARARRAIDRDEHFVADVAAEHGQILDNVSHMTWFVREVAKRIKADTQRWANVDLGEE